jgi:2,3-dihydroxybenzoate decarboxylase
MMTDASAAQRNYRRIATEEAYAPPELIRLYGQLIADGAVDDIGFTSMWGYFLNNPTPRTRSVVEKLQDLGEGRLADMDRAGVDMQILALTAPGVQMLDRSRAVALAYRFNDELAESVARHPDRYAALATIAPQDPAEAAKELERAVGRLGFKGAIVNSHTNGAYLDDPASWAIFEAAEALDVPVYLHPSSPSKGLIEPLLARGLDGAIYGFAVEAGMHVLALIVAGVFDRFPKLKLVVGHLGEALPFWLWRLDFMHRGGLASGRYPNWAKLERRPSDYLRENIYVTTSGMPTPPVIEFCQRQLGMDRVMYAMDYPYQSDPAEVAETEKLDCTAEELAMLFEGNARKVFKL